MRKHDAQDIKLCTMFCIVRYKENLEGNPPPNPTYSSKVLASTEKGFKGRHFPVFPLHRILVLMNGWRDKTVNSGGDCRILRVLKDWSKQHEISVITKIRVCSYRSSATLRPLNLSFFPRRGNRKFTEASPSVSSSYTKKLIGQRCPNRRSELTLNI